MTIKKKNFINKSNMQIKMNNQRTKHYILNIRKNIYQNQETPKISIIKINKQNPSTPKHKKIRSVKSCMEMKLKKKPNILKVFKKENGEKEREGFTSEALLMSSRRKISLLL